MLILSNSVHWEESTEGWKRPTSTFNGRDQSKEAGILTQIANRKPSADKDSRVIQSTEQARNLGQGQLFERCKFLNLPRHSKIKPRLPTMQATHDSHPKWNFRDWLNLSNLHSHIGVRQFLPNISEIFTPASGASDFWKWLSHIESAASKSNVPSQNQFKPHWMQHLRIQVAINENSIKHLELQKWKSAN